MSESSHFLEQILAEPSEDAPRLVYADWLEEHGDADRAELIRLQCERAKLLPWHPRYLPTRAKEAVLLQANFARWTSHLPGEEQGVRWLRFRRGFPAEVEFFNFEVMEQYLESCAAQTPLESVRNAGHYEVSADFLSNIPAIDTVSELTTSGVHEPEDIRRLADAPLLTTLRCLTISNSTLEATALQTLLQSPHLMNLRSLRIPNNYLGNRGVDAIVSSPVVAKLRLAEIDLSEGSRARYHEDPHVDDAGMETLAQWPGLQHVHSLKLSGNRITGVGLGKLLGATSNLKRLDLRANGMDGSDMAAFAQASSGLQLRMLHVGHNAIRNEGVEFLASARCLEGLQALNLNRCEIGSDELDLILQSPFADKLCRLDLADSNITPSGLKALLKRSPLRLHSLNLKNSLLGDTGARAIASSSFARELQLLDLSRNSLSDVALRALRESKNLPNLLRLAFNYNRGIRPDAKKQFRESGLGQQVAVFADGKELEFDEDLELPF